MVPELDLVVVVTAGYDQDYSPRAFIQGRLAGDFASGLHCKRPAPALVCLWPDYAKHMAVDRKANVNHERQHIERQHPECQHLSMADALIAKAERVIREQMAALEKAALRRP
jgi:hypothetical protein